MGYVKMSRKKNEVMVAIKRFTKSDINTEFSISQLIPYILPGMVVGQYDRVAYGSVLTMLEQDKIIYMTQKPNYQARQPKKYRLTELGINITREIGGDDQ